MHSQERLISYFLEGLRDKHLYMHLFGKNHVDFDECCYDAQILDDNCDFGGQLKKMTSSYASSKQGNNVDPNAIVGAIMRKMRLETRNRVPNRSYPLRQYSCGTCGGHVGETIL